jgi:hypothetical protein
MPSGWLIWRRKLNAREEDPTDSLLRWACCSTTVITADLG